ncbi:UDP-3-O-acyl-N-acetylglucosamine deacetylase [Candidatus Caldatribacterium sp.]|uniref:UDP-3-O-acyl-N-acetylglucosamine deacetylase n=1 Tax=Candidatus Caldatribacterium sp. TaxID=2282143 RepID=UPI00299B1873|nr:UDP-3-O-acyl-N-acetylglucosamine deacetylase [Candidatus Caldatribacterium sp.]MDW8080398.1 UDP-3-O-acyl-N-acetylglucosamine deacetylase [Candidatus Calescibacterium sp.]
MSVIPLQRTIERSVTLMGYGLHGGRPTRVTLYPGEPCEGICFRIVWQGKEKVIPALFPYAVLGPRCSVLQHGEASVATVEHLLGACWVAGIDNLVVAVEGEELPAGDGSALHWMEAFAEAGIREQQVPRRMFSIPRVFTVASEGKYLFAFPALEFTVAYILDGTLFGEFLQGLTLQEGEMLKTIAEARTFAFFWEGEALKQQGLGMGVRDKALLLDAFGFGGQPFRLPYEACAHKVLDLLGDLMLLGVRVRGGFLGLRSGHALNHEMVRMLWEEMNDGDHRQNSACGP